MSFFAGNMFSLGIIIFHLFARTHITGALTHGREGYAFVDLHEWPHDSNLTIHVLMNVLEKQEYLPEVLFVQLDNTARENKNQYVLAFLALLVEERIFSEVI